MIEGNWKDASERALRTIRMAVDGKKDDPEFLANWGIVLMEHAVETYDEDAKELTATGMEKLEGALEAAPTDPTVVCAYAYAVRALLMIPFRKEALPVALERIDGALAEHPESFPLWAEKALVLAHVAHSGREEEHLQAALAAAREAARHGVQDERWPRFWAKLGVDVLNAASAIEGRKAGARYHLYREPEDRAPMG